MATMRLLAGCRASYKAAYVREQPLKVLQRAPPTQGGFHAGRSHCVVAELPPSANQSALTRAADKAATHLGYVGAEVGLFGRGKAGFNRSSKRSASNMTWRSTPVAGCPAIPRSPSRIPPGSAGLRVNNNSILVR